MKRGLLHSPAHENLTISVRSDRGMNPSPILPILLTFVRFSQLHRGAFLFTLFTSVRFAIVAQKAGFLGSVAHHAFGSLYRPQGALTSAPSRTDIVRKFLLFSPLPIRLIPHRGRSSPRGSGYRSAPPHMGADHNRRVCLAR